MIELGLEMINSSLVNPPDASVQLVTLSLCSIGLPHFHFFSFFFA